MLEWPRPAVCPGGDGGDGIPTGKGAAGQQPTGPGELVSEPDVILIGKRDEVEAIGGIVPDEGQKVLCRRAGAVAARAQPHPAVRVESRDLGHSIIGGAIVSHDDSEVDVILVENGFELLTNPRGAVAAGDEHEDSRCAEWEYTTHWVQYAPR